MNSLTRGLQVLKIARSTQAFGTFARGTISVGFNRNFSSSQTQNVEVVPKFHPNGKPRRLRINDPTQLLPDFSKTDPVLDHLTPEEEDIFLDKSEDEFGFRPIPSTPPEVAKTVDEELVYSEELGITYEQFRGLQKKVLSMRRTVNMTRKGKIPSMSALVVVGNGNGAAGYGEGKDSDAGRAVQKATLRAIKNIIYFDRYDDRTLFHDIEHKFKATNLLLFSRPPGFGNRSNLYVHEICKCVGIQDISSKVRGSRNPINVIKATFEALQKQRDPEQIAKARGKKLVDVQHMYYGASS
ncbi:28S ribosomal protein S5, mitochondrial [Basidiobolus ranarum]|uniref:28S ribosomal protein S5, mitochondrial n=1 Tax=Basidiobolus ranarum TaxID=34480 RepID=A0ABR2WYG8_9FUNG